MSITEDNILTRVLEKKISRRSFVKWSAALGATASMSGLVMQTGAKMASGQVYTPAAGVGGTIVDWKPTCCLVCHSWCHVACGMDANGHIRKIEGAGGQPKRYASGATVKSFPLAAVTQQKPDDANHIPTAAGYLAYAPHNKGRICAKGNDGVEHLYDPDRIKYPLRRVAGRGEGQWQRITWDEALNEIANTLRELAGLTTKTDLVTAIPGARGQDLRHRFGFYVGRNENGAPKTFSKGYGTPNHIEHTSLCELGRHVAGRTMWGHHWSSVDMQVHTDGFGTPWPLTAQGGPPGNLTLTLDSNLHDIDCYIEWGGNPCEAKIPHSTWANHLGDRRKRNLEGFAGGGRTGTVYGRVICIDVRQSNTAAWADEWISLVPGTDGAVALGILRYVMETRTTTLLRRELEKGHMGGTGGLIDTDGGYNAANRLYYGLFTAEESGGVASGSAACAVPAGKSLESYLFGLGGATYTFAGHLGCANTLGAIQAAVATVSGVSAADQSYLGDLFIDGNGGQFLNVVVDTYRGPVKHTNGVYNTRAIRALQILAPNYSGGQWAVAFGQAAPAVGRGGYNAPGGFISDNNWNPYDFGGGIAALGLGAGMSGVTLHMNANLPTDQGVKQGDNASTTQRVDDWDYDYDVPRWRGAYKWIDQNFSPGIRHSVGLHPFVMGSPANKYDPSTNPTGKMGPYYYKNWRNKTLGTFDTTFQMEAILVHKNAPGYARPQQNNEVELLVATDGSGNYLLKHLWSIDIAMGDGTRFADIILPDGTYLERYAERSGEGQEFNYRDNRYFRIPVYEVNESVNFGGTTGWKSVPRHMYDSRQVRAIMYELARKVEPGNTVPTGASAPWNGDLYNAFNWITGDAGSVSGNAAAGNAHYNDGEYANKSIFTRMCNGGTMNATGVAAGATDGEDFMRAHAMLWNSNDRPAYWRATAYAGGEVGGTGSYAPNSKFKPPAPVGNKLTVFNSVLESMPDIVVNNADDGVGTKVNTYATRTGGDFFGTPVWIPPFQLASMGSTYPLHLTTYKVNVHVQSRTMQLPRLAEILGNGWAVIHPDTANGTNPVNAALVAAPIANGDTVHVTSETGTIEAVAKVTEKARRGCVHISHSMGHRKGVYAIDDDEGNPNRAAFGNYRVSEDGGLTYQNNRLLSQSLHNPAPSPCDAWALALPPSAPGKGTHCNIVITHHVNGDAGTGRNISTDAIGGDQAWFDTKVKIEKV